MKSSHFGINITVISKTSKINHEFWSGHRENLILLKMKVYLIISNEFKKSYECTEIIFSQRMWEKCIFEACMNCSQNEIAATYCSWFLLSRQCFLILLNKFRIWNKNLPPYHVQTMQVEIKLKGHHEHQSKQLTYSGASIVLIKYIHHRGWNSRFSSIQLCTGLKLFLIQVNCNFSEWKEYWYYQIISFLSRNQSCSQVLLCKVIGSLWSDKNFFLRGHRSCYARLEMKNFTNWYWRTWIDNKN